MRGGASRTRAALLALLLLELGVMAAQPGDPPGPEPVPEVRDRIAEG